MIKAILKSAISHQALPVHIGRGINALLADLQRRQGLDPAVLPASKAGAAHTAKGNCPDMNQIGFVLLTHANPPQIKRLVSRLNTMFDAPPIVIHHDFGKCPLPEEFLPSNVSFVRPHFQTGWAAFSVVLANLRGLELLFARPDAPEWAVVLSGTHYPTKPAARIVQELIEGGFDAHIDARPIGREYQQTNWHRMYYQRHCVKHFTFASFDKRLRPKTRTLSLPRRLGDRLLPFHAGLRPFGGSQWFSISRRAAEYMAAFQATPNAAALARHYRNIPFSEEAYFQTALCNNSELKLNLNNWLYLDWSEEKFHPKTLTLADLPALQSSSTHFARKFDPDQSAALLDALDEIIDRDTESSIRAQAEPTPAAEKASLL